MDQKGLERSRAGEATSKDAITSTEVTAEGVDRLRAREKSESTARLRQLKPLLSEILRGQQVGKCSFISGIVKNHSRAP